MRSFHCAQLCCVLFFCMYCVCCVSVCRFSNVFRVCRIHLFFSEPRTIDAVMLNCFHALALWNAV